MEWSELPGLFPGLPEPGRWLALLQEHAALLRAAEAHTRVTSVAAEDAVRRHYAESLEVWRIAVDCLDEEPVTAVDVGSGGGFPGLVIACVAPTTRCTLVEPLHKRARLLRDIAAGLGLENVTVLAERAEEAGHGRARGGAALVTARAVASLPELLEYTAPFAAAGGLIALPKGSAWEAEVAASAHAAQELGCRFHSRVPMRPGVSEAVSVLLFEQVVPVPDGYPRRPGVPHRRPL